MMHCLLCDFKIDNNLKFTNHLKKFHNITYKDYYDLFFKKDNDGICKTCGKETKFERNQYRQFCCVSCMRNNKDIQEKIRKTSISRYGGVDLESSQIKKKAENTNLIKYGVKNPYQIKEVKENAHKLENIRRPILEFEQKNNCIWIRHIIEQYGCGWLYSDLKLDYIIDGHKRKYIKSNDIKIIQDYSKHKYKHFEDKVLNYIQQFYNGNVIRNSNKYIYPYELDFYFPDLKIAIECNGSYWHSIEAGIYDKDYHLKKTIMCENVGIRLIHIFEDNWLNNCIQLFIKNVFMNDEIISDNITYLDRSKDNIRLYLDNGYHITNYSLPSPKTVGKHTLYDCGQVYIQKNS